MELSRLMSVTAITSRLNAVEELSESAVLCGDLAAALADINDLERQFLLPLFDAHLWRYK